jgi:hypothetical protein
VRHPSERVALAVAWTLHALVLAVGAVQAWSHRFEMNPDGVAYLDIAQRFAGGDWAGLLNGYWSPLYSVLLGIALRITQPSPTGEFVLAHGVNLCLYLAAYAVALWFAREIERDRAPEPTSGALQGPWSPVWCRLGFTGLFLWCTAGLIPLGGVTPDLAGLAIVVSTAATLVRLRRGRGGWASAMGFGALLGLGYLARAALLLLAPVWLGVLAATGRGRERGAVLLWAVIGFVILSAPFVLALSRVKGRLTFGDAGRLNYAWFVTGPRTLGPDAGDSEAPLLHPVRRVLADPPVYEFAQPVPGTYPVSTDPSYWLEGLPLRFDPASQWAVLIRHFKRYGTILAPLLAAGVVLAAAAGLRRAGQAVVRNRALLTVCLAAMLLYALVHVERRFVAPWVLIGSAALGFVESASPAIPPGRFLLGLGLSGLLLFGSCGLRNFVCGTGTTTQTMLLGAELLLGAVLIGRLLRDRAPASRVVGYILGGIVLALVSAGDPLVAALGTALLGGLLARGHVPMTGLWVHRGVAAWCLGVLVMPIVGDTGRSAVAIARRKARPGFASIETARALRDQGLRPGDAVASIGNSFEAYWARVARARIVTEVPASAAQRFWSADSSTQARAIAAFTMTGARAVVADWSSAAAVPPCWIRVDDGHLLRWLEPRVSCGATSPS